MNKWKIEVVNPLTDEQKEYLVNLISEYLSEYYSRKNLRKE